MGRKRHRKGLRRLLPTIKLDLDLDRWVDILGYGLLAVAGLTILSFLSANHGAVPAWWLGLLRKALGWGAFFMPLLVGAFGLWLVLRDFGERLPVTPLQGLGIALGYLALLITLHFAAASLTFDGDLWAVAEAGLGGGYLGAALTGPLVTGLGSAGLIVVLLTGWLIVIAVTFEVTVRDAIGALRCVVARLRVGWSSPLPSPPDEEPVRQPAGSPEGQDSDQPEPVEQPAVITTASPSATGNHPHVIGADRRHRLPPLDEILDPGNDHDVNAAILREQARIIEETMESLGAPVRVREINHGPVVTQFGIEPLVVRKGGKERRVKVSRITSRADDLALALEAKTVRFQAPIPGKKLIGLELPNPEFSMVGLRDVIESEAFAQMDSSLRLCLGEDVSGHPVVTDLARMPHLLIAGATGSGKSVCLNAIIATLLLQNTPDKLRLLMIDPKRVELTGYNAIPHLLADVVVDVERVTQVLNWVLAEMDGRYRHFSETRASHIDDYNARVAPRLGKRPLPYIVVIVDELADLMMVAPQHVERSICRIAQMARATGIHLVIATQRPSVDVVTGLIKANFPARIAFNVASAVDSRVILDVAGAEQLLSRGDMLFQPPDAPTPKRLQGTFVSDGELRRLVHYWKEEAKPKVAEPGKLVQKPLWDDVTEQEPAVEYEDELLPDVIDLVLEENRASISLMQRKLRIGYTRAARIMDILKANDVVGPQPSGGRARDVFPDAARALLHPESEDAQGLRRG